MEFKPYSLKPLFHPSNANNSSDQNFQNSASLSALNAVFKLNFEAVIACDNHIFVGTLDGTIIHLTVDFQAQSNTDVPNTQLIQIFNLERGKKVQKLACHKKLKLLLVLCDNTLSIYNFNLDLQEQYEPQTGVTQFDLDFFSNQLDIGILCLVKQKNLKIFLLTNELVLRKNIPLQENITSLCYSGNNVIVSDTYYKLIDLRRSISLKLAPIQVKTNTGSGSKLELSIQNKKPIVIFIDDQEFMVVSGDENGSALGMFFNSSGDPSRGTLSWPVYPKWVGFDFPFTIAILPNSQVYIHNIVNQQLFQKITLPDRLDLKGLVDHCDLQHFLPNLDQKLNRGRDEDLQASTLLTTNLVWGKNFILAFQLKPVLLEIDPLLDTFQLERSILIAEQYSTLLSPQSIHYYRMRRELEHIYQKCGLLYIQQTLLDDAVPLLIQGNMDPTVIINLFPDFKLPNVDNSELSLDPGIFQLTKKFTNFRDIIKFSLNQNYLTEQDEDKVEDLLLIKNFYQMLETYLQRARVKYFDGDSYKKLNNDQLMAIDTTLIKLISTEHNYHKLEKFLNQEGVQYFKDDLIGYLTSRSKLYPLSLIYKKGENFGKVVEIWKELYEEKASPFDNGDQDLDKFINLTNLIKDVELNWDLVTWLLEKNSSYGLKNLKKLTKETLIEIGIPKILEHLTTNNLIDCKLEFLEFLLANEISNDENLHFELIEEYYNKLKSLFQSDVELTRELKAQERAFIIHYTINPNSTFLSYLTQKTDKLSNLRSNLVQFLIFSNKLDYTKLLRKFQQIQLIKLELSVIYSKLNEYEKSIELLVNLQDFNQVELNCIKLGAFEVSYLVKPTFPNVRTAKNDIKLVKEDLVGGEEGDWSKKKLFNSLFNCLLGFNDEHTVLIQASSLLSRHYTMFDLLDVLSKLPSHWSLDLFSPYLLKSLKKLNQKNNNLEIVKALSISENIKTNHDLIETIQSVNKGGNGPLLINEGTRCGKCQKFLGDSVISILPVDKNESNRYIPIYHLHCVQNQS